MRKEVKSIQNDETRIILSNPLASPKFVREIANNKFKSVENDTYKPKVFYEIVSRLKPEHLEGIKRNESIVFDLNIKDFLGEIGANIKNFKYLINAVKSMQSTLLSWKEGEKGNKKEITVSIITKSIHHENTGKLQIFVDSDLAKHILDVSQKQNFSFLKSNVFRLQNAQAIRLYPFFKSWLNYCFNEETGKKQPYETELNRFKEQFGYDTSGYVRFAMIEKRVLKPAIEEINEKTDLIVSYETTGENLDGLRPRVTGLMFRIIPKDQVIKKQLPSAEPQEQAPLKEVVTAMVEALKTTEPTASQPQTPQEQVKKEPQKNKKELYDLFKKIEIKARPDEITTGVLIDSWIESMGYEVVKDGFLGMISTKAKPDTVAFFTIPNFTKYKGFSKLQEQQEAQKKAEQEEKRKKQEQQKLLESIKKEYQDRKKTQFLKLYEKATEQEKSELLQHIKATKSIESLGIKRNYYINQDTQKLNEGGEVLAGSILAEQKNIGIEVRQSKFQNEVAEKHGYQIGYDQDDQVLILGIFQKTEQISQPQEQSQATEPQTKLIADQQEKIETDKKGLFNKFSNWFKN